MSIHRVEDGVYRIRWREGGRNKSLNVHGPHELAKKILRKRLSARDENRHLDVKREVNFRMSGLIDRYWEQYGSKKRSQDREKSILEGIRDDLANSSSGRLTVPAFKVGTRGLPKRRDYRRERRCGTSTSCTT